MAKHDITSVDSPVVVYVSDEEVYLHSSYHTHLWKQDEPGSPIVCVVCGEEILRRIGERLRSPDYGYA